MPNYFTVSVTKDFHSDLYPASQQTRFKVGYVAVLNHGETNTQEAANSMVKTEIERGFFDETNVVWEDENWSHKNGWKEVENTLTLL